MYVSFIRPPFWCQNYHIWASHGSITQILRVIKNLRLSDMISASAVLQFSREGGFIVARNCLPAPPCPTTLLITQFLAPARIQPLIRRKIQKSGLFVLYLSTYSRQLPENTSVQKCKQVDLFILFQLPDSTLYEIKSKQNMFLCCTHYCMAQSDMAV